MPVIKIEDDILEKKLRKYFFEYEYEDMLDDEKYSLIEDPNHNFVLREFSNGFVRKLLQEKQTEAKYVMVGVSEGNRHEDVSPKYNTRKEAEAHYIDTPHDYTSEIVIKIQPDSIVEPISTISYKISDDLVYYSTCGAIEHRTDNYNIIHSTGLLAHPDAIIHDSLGIYKKSHESVEYISFTGEANGDIFDFYSSNDCIASEFLEIHGQKVIDELLTAKKWSHHYFDKDFYTQNR